MASFPSSVITFTENTSVGQTVQPQYFNDPYNEIVAIESNLLNGCQFNLGPSATNTYSLGSATVAWKNVYVSGALVSTTGNSVNLQPGGNTGLSVAAVAASVDGITVTPSAAGSTNLVVVQASGTDANVNLYIASKGSTGTLTIGSSSTLNLIGNTVQLNSTSFNAVTSSTKTGSMSGSSYTGITSSTNIDATNLTNTVLIPSGHALLVWGNATLVSPGGTPMAALMLHDSLNGIFASDMQTIFVLGDAQGFHVHGVLPGDGSSHTITLQAGSNGAAVNVLNATVQGSTNTFPTMTFVLI